MPRFGKYQTYLSEDLKRLGPLGKFYGRMVGYTQVGGFGQYCWFRKIIKKFNINSQFILDAGCGMGEYSLWIAESFSKSQVDGVDIDPLRIEALNRLQTNLNIEKKVNFRCLNIEHLEEKEKYDLIICIDVLEHLEDTRNILDRFWNALMPGGYCYLRLPTEHQDRLFHERHFEAYNRWEHYEGYNKEHVNPHQSLPSLWKIAKGIGFQKVYDTHTNGWFAKLGFELGIISESYSRFFYALAVPILKGLYKLDTLIIFGKEGNGFILLLQKPSKISSN